MTDPCTQSETIRATYDIVRTVQSSHDKLAISFEALSKSNEKIGNAVTDIQRIISKHMASLAVVGEKVDGLSEDFSGVSTRVSHIENYRLPEIYGKLESQSEKINKIQVQIGKTDISGLDSRVKTAETLLKGALWIASAVFGSMIVLGVNIVFGGGA